MQNAVANRTPPTPPSSTQATSTKHERLTQHAPTFRVNHWWCGGRWAGLCVLCRGRAWLRGHPPEAFRKHQHYAFAKETILKARSSRRAPGDRSSGSLLLGGARRAAVRRRPPAAATKDASAPRGIGRPHRGPFASRPKFAQT